ncbi:MAG: hypothetical protein KAT83_02170 [Candidatus Aenigmarchaeota archaeon]|nr:hypothetical protein [Candidatus Aenigmarchaeota archaeon]
MSGAKKTDITHCTYCDKEITGTAEKCPYCGTKQTLFGGSKNPSAKIPIFGAILSLIFPGLGQIYMGKAVNGIGIISLNIIFGLVPARIPQIILWIYSVVDAYNTDTTVKRDKTKKSKHKEQAQSHEEFKLP